MISRFGARSLAGTGFLHVKSLLRRRFATRTESSLVFPRASKCAASACGGWDASDEGSPHPTATRAQGVQPSSNGELQAGTEADDFDWKLAVALAGCSFFAYADVNDQGLIQRTPGESEISYTDEEFLKRKMAGIFNITLHQVKGLSSGNGKDVSCTLSIGDSTLSTTARGQGPDLEFEDGCGSLYVRDPTRQRLCLRLVSGSGDELVGSAMRRLDDCTDEQPRDEWLTLGGEGGPRVLATLRFVPFTDPLLAGSAANSEMGGPVLGTPGQALMPEDWKRLQAKLFKRADAAFQPIAFIRNPVTDTELWGFWNLEQRQLVVAFRGTETTKWKDVLTDISMAPMKLSTQHVVEAPRRAPLAELSAQPSTLTKVLKNVEQAKKEVAAKRMAEEQRSGAAASAGDGDKGAVAAAVDAIVSTASDLQEVLSKVKAAIDANEEDAPPADEPWVHSGFLQAYDSVRGEVLGLVETVLAGEEGDWTVLTTGHSLGAALATLLAYDLGLRPWSNRPEVVMYNFGSPRVGNKAFAAQFNRRVPNAWRVVNSKDFVVTIPRLMGYAHVGHAAVVTATGAVEFQKDSAEAPFEGTAVHEVLTATVSSAVPNILKSVGEEIAGEGNGSSGDEAPPAPALTSQELADLWETEKQAWSALFGGTAIDDHLENLYFSALEAAVDRALAGARGGGAARDEGENNTEGEAGSQKGSVQDDEQE